MVFILCGIIHSLDILTLILFIFIVFSLKNYALPPLCPPIPPPAGGCGLGPTILGPTILGPTTGLGVIPNFF
jgi:hypothetical protein